MSGAPSGADDPRSPGLPGGVPGESGPPASAIRVRGVLVEGRVQGVWFRDSAWQQATRLGVNGWVRNLPDGRVEMAYEGPRDVRSRRWSRDRRGPERATVTTVEVYEEEPKGERGFSVR